jgi:hypothetical protein
MERVARGFSFCGADLRRIDRTLEKSRYGEVIKLTAGLRRQGLHNGKKISGKDGSGVERE